MTDKEADGLIDLYDEALTDGNDRHFGWQLREYVAELRGIADELAADPMVESDILANVSCRYCGAEENVVGRVEHSDRCPVARRNRDRGE